MGSKYNDFLKETEIKQLKKIKKFLIDENPLNSTNKWQEPYDDSYYKCRYDTSLEGFTNTAAQAKDYLSWTADTKTRPVVEPISWTTTTTATDTVYDHITTPATKLADVTVAPTRAASSEEVNNLNIKITGLEKRVEELTAQLNQLNGICRTLMDIIEEE